MNKNIQSKISIAVAMALLTGSHALAQENNEQVKSEQENTAESGFERVQVTGSRIKRSTMEGVNPITMLSSEDILAQGHATAFDALNALSVNTGIFVGEENSNNFNANAQALNFRGFGPGYTLVLINGRRVPVLPKPSGAVDGNVVNLALIPTEAIDRIEVLSGGASAIYGSDAVAGVVNFILKKDFDETLARYRYGDTKDGGGESHVFQMLHGGKVGKGSFMAGIEVNQVAPIFGDDRDWFDEPSDSPNPTRHQLPQVMSFWSRFDPDSFNLIDISDRCAGQSYTPDAAPWVRPFRGEENPQWCGDNIYNTYTIRNERDRAMAFARLDYPINADTDLSMDLIISNSSANAGLYRYSYSFNYDVVEDGTDVSAGNDNWLASRHMFRSFRDFETNTSNQEFEETSYTLISSLTGVVFDEYDYDVSLTLSKYDYEDSVVRFDDQTVLGLLFGQKGVDWDQPWEGSRWVVTNRSNLNDRLQPTGLDLFGDLSPEQFESALHTSTGAGDSHIYNLGISLAGDVFEMPAGTVQFASIIEFINEGYEFITDAPTVNGDIFGWSGIVGEGERNRWAVGAEFLVPLLTEDSGFGALEATLAARYDRYNDESSVGGAGTYQVGLTWRPMNGLMVRGQRATAFRAPDMHLLYAQPSSSFNRGTDFLTCVTEENIQPGESWAGCSDNYGTGAVRQSTEGDINLKEETGFSNTLGIVADITESWDFSIDYYQIRLEDQVSLASFSTILRFEAECLLGFSQFAGVEVDQNSARCQEMLSRVTRNGRSIGDINSVSEIANRPFNTGFREQSGFDIATRYELKDTAYGTFYADLKYTHILETLQRFLPEDDIEDIRDDADNREFRTRTNLTLGWYNDDAWIALFANRLGSSPIQFADEPERYSAWTRYTLSGGYDLTEELHFSVSINNLFNKRPPQHESEEFWPFAAVSKYNPVGTEYFASITYQF